MKKHIIITNNPYVKDKYEDEFKLVYLEDKGLLDVMEYVREKIHEGHILKTHPLSGSVKPNETPYKTILISESKGQLDMDSLAIIEESIISARKFQEIEKTPLWTESVLDDFRVIDLSLIENVIEMKKHG